MIIEVNLGMYKVLIIEDEVLVRMGIKSSINWGKYSMQVVGEVGDGVSGLYMIEKHEPDIIITDINLPRLNGVDVIKKTREINKHSKIIVISCIDEFDTVRQLLQCDVSDYLLKSKINVVDIEKSLINVKNLLDQERGSREIINDKCPGKEEGNSYSYLWQEADNKSLGTLITEKIFYEHVLFVSFLDKPKNEELMLKMVFELFDKNVYLEKGYYAINKNNRYLMIFLKDKAIDLDDLKKNLETWITYVKKSLNMELLCSIEDVDTKVKIFNQFHLFSELIETMECKRYGASVRQYLTQRLLDESFKLRKVIVSLLSEYVSEEIDMTQFQFIEEFKQYMKNLLSKLAEQYGGRAIQELKEIIYDMDNQFTYCAIYKISCKFIEVYNNEFYSKKDMKKEVLECLEYIHTHYNDSCTLDEISKSVCLSPNYISTIFRKDMRITLIDYIIKVRIEKTRKLLECTDKSLYIIAEEVGFSSDSYLSKRFKKLTGFSPNRWRKLFNRG